MSNERRTEVLAKQQAAQRNLSIRFTEQDHADLAELQREHDTRPTNGEIARSRMLRQESEQRLTEWWSGYEFKRQQSSHI